MPVADVFTLEEILSQPEAWSKTVDLLAENRARLKAFLAEGHFDSLLFTGCGSTYYLALAGAALLRDLSGFPAIALPGSEIWLNGNSTYVPSERPLLVVVSRSGETTETLRACEAFKNRTGGKILTFTNYPETSLTAAGDFNLVIPAGQEESFAQTRAFTTLYLATVELAALMAGREDLLAEMRRLPRLCSELLEQYSSLAIELGSDPRYDRFYFLGSGLLHGLACEASLKMKEMSLSHSEPFHFLEFRHGPKTMVTPSTLVVGLVSERNTRLETSLLAEVEAMGGAVLSLGETNARVSFRSSLPEVLRGVLYLPILQRLACEHALARGLNPDRPSNLTSVIRL